MSTSGIFFYNYQNVISHPISFAVLDCGFFQIPTIKYAVARSMYTQNWISFVSNVL